MGIIDECYQRSDARSREQAIKYFQRLGIKLQNFARDPEAVPDLANESGSFFVEVEHKSTWIDKDWPFPTIHGLGRKATSMLRTGKVALAILSNDFQRICIVPPKVCQKYSKKLRGIANRRVRSGKEKFFDVPLNECFFDTVDKPVEFFGFQSGSLEERIIDALR